MSTYIIASFSEVADRRRLLELEHTGPALRAFELELGRYDTDVREELCHMLKYGEDTLKDNSMGPMDRWLPLDFDYAKTYDETKREHARAIDTLDRLIAQLREAFAEDTAVGEGHLTITPAYHEGDEGDEVDGFYYEIGGLWQHTPAAERHADRIGVRRAFYTS